MTTLHVLGSGSRGNAFALASEGAVLLLDAGFSLKELDRRAALAGVDLHRLVGVALTHEHGDHASGARRLAARHAVPIVSSPGTFAALAGGPAAGHVAVHGGVTAEVGPFTVRACATPHDAAEPLALVVHAPDGASVGLAYDLGRVTSGVRFLLRGMSAVVLESNYDEVMLRTSAYPPSVQARIAGHGGHLSNHAAAELLAELCHADLGVVVLAHLSQQCNADTAARAVVEPALRRAGFRGALHVARQDAPLPPIPLAPGAGGQLALGLGPPERATGAPAARPS